MNYRDRVPGKFLDDFDLIYYLCDEYQVEFKLCTPYHWKITGDFVVNFYPSTNKVYIEKTNKGYYEHNLEKVVRASMEFPDKIPTANNRKSNKGTLNRLWKKGERFCYICDREIREKEDASVDHVIPLSKGGSDRVDNKKLVHRWCNHEKDDKLPTELGFSGNSNNSDNYKKSFEAVFGGQQFDEDKKFWRFISKELFDIEIIESLYTFPFEAWYLTGTLYQEPERFGFSFGINTSEYPLLYLQIFFWSFELLIEKRIKG